MNRGVVGLTGGFVGTAGLVGAARAAFREMGEAQKVSRSDPRRPEVDRQGGQGLRQAGRELAEALMTMSGIDDEVIQSGREHAPHVHEHPQREGQGQQHLRPGDEGDPRHGGRHGQGQASRSAIQVGKALNDPIKGVTALHRVGVQFTERRRDQIEALVESGDIAGGAEGHPRGVHAGVRRKRGGSR